MNRRVICGADVEQRLGTVARRLSAIPAIDLLDRDRLLHSYIGLFDALRLAIESLRGHAALETALEALVLFPPGPGLPALAEIGLRPVEALTWEVRYLDVEYQVQRRPSVLAGAALAFSERFRAFHREALDELAPAAA